MTQIIRTPLRGSLMSTVGPDMNDKTVNSWGTLNTEHT